MSLYVLAWFENDDGEGYDEQRIVGRRERRFLRD